MEFAEWVVSGLDQLRSGQLPGGDGLYHAVAAGLGGNPALDAFMNGGDDAARAALVQAIAQAVAADPAFEQQIRQAAQSTHSTQTQSMPVMGTPGVGAPGGQSFFKTTNGKWVLAGIAAVVVLGGVGLGVGLSGGDSGLASVLKGTWTCTGVEGDTGTATIGDSTWSVDGEQGTWKQNGNKGTITIAGRDFTIAGMPSGAGPFDVTLSSATRRGAGSLRVQGTISAHKVTLTATVSEGSASPSITCTK